MAYKLKSRDFEDSVLAFCAINSKCDLIITRNTKDYEDLEITVLTPTDFLDYFYNSYN